MHIFAVINSPMLLRFLLMLLVAGSIFGGLALTKRQQFRAMAEKFSVPAPPTRVAVTTVTRKSWPRIITGTGSLTAVQDAFVTNEAPGIVAALNFESGQTVTKGEPLVILESSVDAAVLNGLLTEQRLAVVQFERAAKLVRDRTLAQAQYDEAAARRDRAAADVLAQQAQLAKKTIRAPFSGTLGIRRIDLGDYLKAGSPMVTLQTLDPIYLDSAIPERFIPQLKIGQQVRVRVQAYGDERFSGRLLALEPGVDTATRMIRVRAELPNPDQRLRPGMFVEVEAVEDTAQEVDVVPETAITYSPYGNSVFVVIKNKEGLTVERRQIETGTTRSGEVAITKGIQANEQVVVVGQNKLRNGLSVEIVADHALQSEVAPSATH